MDNLYSILGKIKTENRRLTSTRIGILKSLFEVKQPLESKQIKKWLKKNGVSVDRTTIYRQLRYLVSKKFLSKFQLESGRIYFELAQDHHHHLICLRCQNIQNISLGNCADQFTPRLSKENKFKVLGHSLEFYGLCEKCQEKPVVAKQA